MELEIRTARMDDAEAIADILAKTFAEYRPLYTAEAFAAITPSATGIKARFNKAGLVWVALMADRIVGTVSVVPRSGAILYVRSLAVMPCAQGLRIGERMLSEIESYAVANGYRTLTLSTSPLLSRALRLYDRCGFIRIGPVDFHGTELIAMKKYLDE